MEGEDRWTYLSCNEMLAITRKGKSCDCFLGGVEDVRLFVSSGVEQHHNTAVDRDSTIYCSDQEGKSRRFKINMKSIYCVVYGNVSAFARNMICFSDTLHMYYNSQKKWKRKPQENTTNKNSSNDNVKYRKIS